MATDVVVLDHLAVAVEDPVTAWPRYRGELGGRWANIAGLTPGFEFSQVEYVGGLKIEVLAPHEWEQNDFLRRFLDHSGPGPHHLTFKVPNLGVMLGRCAAMGYRIVGERRENPNWQEAFLHPKDGAGVVIQLAQQGDGDAPDLTAAHWPGNPDGPQARFVHVAHAVTEFHTHVRRFTELLDGVISGHGTDDELRADTMDIDWPNGARVRLLRPAGHDSPLSEWLGDRHAKIHHAAFTGVGEPGTVIEPEANLGLRLRFL